MALCKIPNTTVREVKGKLAPLPSHQSFHEIFLAIANNMFIPATADELNDIRTNMRQSGQSNVKITEDRPEAPIKALKSAMTAAIQKDWVYLNTSTNEYALTPNGLLELMDCLNFNP